MSASLTLDRGTHLLSLRFVAELVLDGVLRLDTDPCFDALNESFCLMSWSDSGKSRSLLICSS